MTKQPISAVLWAMSFAVALSATEAVAAIEPACLFNDNMVLQRGKPVPVWGRATAGNEIKVCFVGECVKTVAGEYACHPSEGLLRDLKLFSRHFGVAIPYESELGKTSAKK